MLYQKFADTNYCTIEFEPGHGCYAAAKELAIDITKHLLNAHKEAIASQSHLDRSPHNPTSQLLAEYSWDTFVSFQDLAARNPNARAHMAANDLEYLLEEKEPGA